MNQEHTIQRASVLTGLTPHVIRAWERRYAALTPRRTPSNRRLFTDEDIEQLRLLRQAVQSGHKIGRIAGLPLEELRRFTTELPAPASILESAAESAAPCKLEPSLDACLLVIRRLDAEAFENFLAQAASSLGTAAMLDRIVVPLLDHLGTGWRSGNIRIADEHMATMVLRAYLMRAFRAFQPGKPAPLLIVTTPVGQHHEFGALLAAVTAALQGWRILYLGPNLPTEEIAGAVHRSGARAVALSIVYPSDDPRLSDELLTLRRCLGNDIPILVGGRDTTAYRDVLTSIDALIPSDLQNFRTALDAIQSCTAVIDQGN